MAKVNVKSILKKKGKGFFKNLWSGMKKVGSKIYEGAKKIKPASFVDEHFGSYIKDPRIKTAISGLKMAGFGKKNYRKR
jgi:hypothetical protein